MGQQLRPVIGSLVPGRSDWFPLKKARTNQEKVWKGLKFSSQQRKKLWDNLEDIAGLDEITGGKKLRIGLLTEIACIKLRPNTSANNFWSWKSWRFGWFKVTMTWNLKSKVMEVIFLWQNDIIFADICRKIDKSGQKTCGRGKARAKLAKNVKKREIWSEKSFLKYQEMYRKGDQDACL